MVRKRVPLKIDRGNKCIRVHIYLYDSFFQGCKREKPRPSGGENTFIKSPVGTRLKICTFPSRVSHVFLMPRAKRRLSFFENSDATAILDLRARIVKISTCRAVRRRARMAVHAEPSIPSTTNAAVLPVSFSTHKI